MASAASTVKMKPRHDPANRLVDGQRGRDKLIGRDPDKHYVMANRAHPSGEENYRVLGYEVVCSPRGDEPGVRLFNGLTSKPGEPIEQSGHVLMSCSMERYREIMQSGHEECGGQDEIDRFEQKVVNKDNHTVDGLRGFGKYIRITDQTTGEELVNG